MNQNNTNYEIRLVVNRTDQGLTACWIEQGGQPSNNFPLFLPLGKADTADLRWYLEKHYEFHGAGDLVTAKRIEGQIKQWGTLLYKAIFGSVEGHDVYRNLIEKVDAGIPGLITIGSVDSEMLVQPWELLRDSYGVMALRGVTLRRQLITSKPSQHYDFTLPLRILLIVSRPSNVGFIDPRNSIPPVLDARDALGGQVQVEFCDPPTLPRLERLISEARKNKRPYHLVHFDGHGTYLPETGVGALVFENEDATRDLVTGVRFGELMSRLQIPLVLLEACRGADLSEQPVFGSLAPALLESGVGSVVAFSHSVHIQAARILVERFYQELVSGGSVGAALQEARAAMLAQPHRFLHLGPIAQTIELQDWFIPQLYQVGDDPVLLPRPEGAASVAPLPPAPPPALPGFPPEPMYKFHGRALELLQVERAFRKHTAVLVNGMGGMGKTALGREAASWWLRTGRFERAVFISFEQKATPARVVQLIGTAFEGADFSRRSDGESDPEGQRQKALSLFRQHPVLVVWDNFESTLPIYQREIRGEGEGEGLELYNSDDRAEIQALYRQLVEGKPLGRLLVTCRPEQTGLPGIKEYQLRGLSRPDSLYLLAAILDVKGISTERPGYETEEIEALLDLLDDHPLSIELVAPHLKDLTPEQIRTDFAALLERFKNPDAKEERNKGLYASLEFSRKRLSPAAQAALPWLAWFEGGVFEMVLLDFAEMKEEVWEPLRLELVDTALIKVEDVGFNTPYLRFHPTLRYAARMEEAGDPVASGERFIQLYLAIMNLADKLLRGDQPAAGMALMAREEANFRGALQLALAHGQRQAVGKLADTLQRYLESAGRNRERAALTAWVHAHLPADVLDEAACDATRQHASTLLTQGQAGEAVRLVQALLERLLAEGLAGGDDPAFQIAVAYGYLGRIYVNANRPDLALEPAQQAIRRFEGLPGEDARSNLSVALGDLANAYMGLGRLDEALQVAERGLAIDREFHRHREIAVDLGRIAAILTDAHRYPEAEARYAEAMQAAQEAGDVGLQALALQHQGVLHRNLEHYIRAVELFQQAIALFQQVNDPGNEMRTCDLLATSERQRGELDAAEAWYLRARQMAEQLQDQAQLAAEAQNLGILYQNRAAAAQNEPERRLWLDRAVASVEQSLAIALETHNQPGAANSYFQLGKLHRLRGDMDQAEQNLLKSVEINEAIDKPDIYMDYAELAQVARARGDEAAAAEWQAKAEAKYAEIKRRERGEGEEVRVSDELVQFILQVARACYQVGHSKAPIPPDLAEALAQMKAAAAPFPEIGAFLLAAAQGKPLPPVPAGLPEKIAEILTGLKQAMAG
jgi:tetratricopeptide (TPR) repeat protein